MKPLTIELMKGAKRQLQSVGWKTAKDNDCRRHFFALAPDGKPLVVTPKVAMPDFYDPLRQARAILSCEPFPESVCIEISPSQLLPPPCYQSREEFERQREGHFFFEPWRWIYIQTHNQVLLLAPSDDGPLRERLDRWLDAMRAAYAHEAALWRDRITRAKTAALQELGFDNEEQREKRLVELRGQLDIVESENLIEGVPCKGRLKLTLADVKRGNEGIRDAWMHEDWAAKNGEDLALMFRERHAFRRWLETHTGTRANVFDMTTRERRHEIAPPGFGERFENNPQFLEGCAQVRYRARFADNANTVVYLSDCELREELTADEHEELARLTFAGSRSMPPAASTSSPSADPQFEYVNVQGTEWRKAGPQMVRRGELAEHQRTTKDDSTFRKLLDVHRERWFYLTKQIADVRKPGKGKKKSRVAAMFDLTDWDSRWHPPGKPNWSHPGKKSE
ncbi:MAG TPA: hypothetical protein VFW05_13700 [Verrucomicrobiae bacterium]|nr:hypothetical protein [Verrucomicrobiae bacterium]